jgi:hypothetical protein
MPAPAEGAQPLTDWVKQALTRKRRRIVDKMALQETAQRAAQAIADAADDVPPSEKLVLGVKFAIALTFSFAAIEIANLALLHEWNSEVFASITGLAGTITGILISQKAY